MSFKLTGKKWISLLIALTILLTTAWPALAITGGQPDGNLHPFSALLLVPGYTICSGTLIDEDLVLTAGHCTSFWNDENIKEVYVTFDSNAAVDRDTWLITGGTWYKGTKYITHPGYDDAEWPFTWDYGLVKLTKAVKGITPATLPESGVVDSLMGDPGQSGALFNDVGYGQNGVSFEGQPYYGNFDFVRKYSTQFYNPSQGAVGTQDARWLILQDVPNDNFGAGCGGDSGSGIFMENVSEIANTVVSIHTGGYRMGWMNQLCGRMTSLNHRVDLPEVLSWIEPYLD